MDKNWEIIKERLTNIENLLLSTKTVLSFEEAAYYTSMSKSYLYKLTSQNLVPYYKPSGKLIYFDKSELDKWLLKNRNQTKDELETKANTILVTKGGAK